MASLSTWLLMPIPFPTHLTFNLPPGPKYKSNPCIFHFLYCYDMISGPLHLSPVFLKQFLTVPYLLSPCSLLIASHLSHPPQSELFFLYAYVTRLLHCFKPFSCKVISQTSNMIYKTLGHLVSAFLPSPVFHHSSHEPYVSRAALHVLVTFWHLLQLPCYMRQPTEGVRENLLTCQCICIPRLAMRDAHWGVDLNLVKIWTFQVQSTLRLLPFLFFFLFLYWSIDDLQRGYYLF